MVEVRWLFYCVVLCMLRSEQVPGFGHAASQLGFGGGRKVVRSCLGVGGVPHQLDGGGRVRVRELMTPRKGSIHTSKL